MKTAEAVTARRLAKIAASQTLAMAARVRELKAKGENIAAFTLGEPDFDTPEHINQAAIAAIQARDTHYPPVAGKPELREGVAAFLNAQFGLDYTAEEIIVSTGAKQSLMNALMALVNPGDEVILAAPYWVSYLPMVQLAEGVPVFVEGKDENGLKITPEDLEEAISGKTRLFIFNNPGNPSGALYTPEETRAIAEALENYPNCYVISDEIYALVRYAEKFRSMATFPYLRDRVLTVTGVSKAFAMTGWRIGFLAGPKRVVQACEKFQGQVTSGACTISQQAALTAISSELGPTYEMVAAFKRRRDLIVDLFREAAPDAQVAVPEGAFYLYPNMAVYIGRTTPDGETLETVDDLCRYLLEEGKVAVVSGTGFGTTEHLRLSYACSEANIREGVARIGRALAALQA